MNAEPLHLFPLEPTLTARQQQALDHIAAAGHAGLASDELGALMHHHADDDRCEFCGSAGVQFARSLRRKGLVHQRRRRAPGGDFYMVWVTVDARKSADVGEFPEGY